MNLRARVDEQAECNDTSQSKLNTPPTQDFAKFLPVTQQRMFWAARTTASSQIDTGRTFFSTLFSHNICVIPMLVVRPKCLVMEGAFDPPKDCSMP